MIQRYLAKRNNPWELLVLATMILLPAVYLLLDDEPMMLLMPVSRYPGRVSGGVVSPRGAHLIGWIVVVFGVALLALYVYARIAIKRDDIAEPPHFLDLK